MRYPEDDDQRRRLHNVTQDRKWADKTKYEAGTAKAKTEDKTTWAPEQLLNTDVDNAGNPEPDPASFSDGSKAKQAKATQNQGVDLYGAMNDDFD